MAESLASDKSVNDMKPGQQGIVLEVSAELALGQRLSALGLLPGARLTFLREAPLGDPVTVSISGQSFALRRLDARGVKIRLID